MYILSFIIILFASFNALYNHKSNPILFKFVYMMLTFIVVFRYGQGTDFFGYMYYYNNVDLYDPFYQKDIGFAVLCSISKNFGLTFTVFNSLFALLTMLVYYPFFNKTCNKSFISLFIFFTYVFLIFPMSGIRQGLTIGILLGYLYPLLISKRYILYFFILIIGSTIHLSLMICAVLPFVQKINIEKRVMIVLFIIGSFIILLNLNLYNLIPFDLPTNRGIDVASADDTLYITGKIFRIIILLLYIIVPDSYYNDKTKMLRNIVFSGFILYSLLSFVSTVAGRLEIYFRVFEMILLYKLIISNKKYFIKLIGTAFIILYGILFFKNIDSQINQGGYIKTNVLNYPYVSLFNQERIYKYRGIY